MKTIATPFCLAILALLGAPTSSMGQERDAPEPTPALVREVGELKQAVREIAAAMRELLKRQEVSILMSRIELQARNVAPLEQEVRRVTAEREGIIEETRMMEARLESLASDREKDPRPPGARPDEQVERIKSEISLQVRLLRERLGSVDLRLAELENDLAKRRDEIRAWEELVDERLDLR